MRSSLGRKPPPFDCESLGDTGPGAFLTRLELALATAAPVSREALFCNDCRSETSSTQYGTSCATSGNSTAHPCINLLNL